MCVVRMEGMEGKGNLVGNLSERDQFERININIKVICVIGLEVVLLE
jgi:hypothetical protein